MQSSNRLTLVEWSRVDTKPALKHNVAVVRQGAAALRGLDSGADCRCARKVARPLQSRIRRALVAYANATVRSADDSPGVIRKARRAATKHLDARRIDEADDLAGLEAELVRSRRLIDKGVARPLRHLLLDWQDVGPHSTRERAT